MEPTAPVDLRPLDVDRPRLAAGLPLAPNDREAFALFQKAKRGAHDVARVRVTSARDLLVDEGREAFSYVESSGHGAPRLERRFHERGLGAGGRARQRRT